MHARGQALLFKTDGGTMNTFAYDVVVGFLRLVAHVFFRTVEVVGKDHVPTEGPVIFVGNHPNSLIDPMLVLVSAPRRVQFAAKDVLFRTWAFRKILQAVGAVPIQRRQDHGGAVDNNAAFSALMKVLEEGGAFGIFPEGISHFRSELQPLKTGAARLALDAWSRGIPVKIVPCGLNYRQRTRLRSRVLIQFGQPIERDDEAVAKILAEAADESDASATPRALTKVIEMGLRAMTINTADFDTLRVLDSVRRLYQPPKRKLSLAERAEISRRFIDHWERLSHVPELEQLYRDVDGYQFKLDALGLKDSDLKHAPSRLTAVTKLVQHVFLLLVMLPFAIPGFAIHFPVLAVAVFIGEALTRRKDVIATTKLGVATTLVLAEYAAVMAGVVYWLKIPDGLFALPLVLALLLFSGWATIRVLERQSILRKGLVVFTLLLNLNREVIGLREARQQLRARLLQLVDTYVDTDLERIVPAAENESGAEP